MAIINIRAASIQQILDYINGQAGFFFDTTDKLYLYRGQASSEWRLVPTAFRTVDKHYPSLTEWKEFYKVVLAIERDIYSDFYNRFRGFKIDMIDTSSPWEILCYAQHYGVPTRLLDWSTNPLVALYYAVKELPSNDAILWCLSKPGRQMLPGIPINQLPRRLDFLQEFQPRFKQKESVGTSLQIIQPPEFDPRIRSQASVFSVQLSSDPEHLIIDQSNALDTKETNLLQIVIPADAKTRIARDLERFGINAAALQTDLAGVAQLLKEQRKQQYIRHEIGVDQYITNARARITEHFQTQYSITDVHWTWQPQKYHQYSLQINGHTFAVRFNLVQVDLNEHFKEFVRRIEEEATKNQILDGEYYINFGHKAHNWGSDDFQAFRHEVLRLVRETKTMEAFDDETKMSDPHAFTVRKVSQNENSVSVGIYPATVSWGDECNIPQALEDQINVLIQNIELHTTLPTILVFSIFGSPECNVNSYAPLFKNKLSNAASVFINAHFDHGFLNNSMLFFKSDGDS